MKTIVLTKNQVALVSDEDFEYLSGFNWCATLKGDTSYARRSMQLSELRDKSKYTMMMHRAIAERMGLDLTYFVDHIDGDGLNNQRSNLRSATGIQNQQNQTRKQKNCSSKYKGVCWHKSGKKWQAQININSTRVCLGSFTQENDAALAYNKAAIEHFGEFAALNKIGYLDTECLNIIPLAINQKILTIQARKPKGCSSEYKGVSWHKCKKWQAQININSTSIYLGLFTEEIDAALAYNAAATKHYGEFAALNIILEQQIN